LSSAAPQIAIVPRMGRSPILPVGAAVAAVALGASPGLVVANPAGRHKENAAISFPLLALASSNSVARPSGHVSHSSHSSHSSHVSSSHSSHGSHHSHHSHYSSSPTLPPPPSVPPPSPTATQSSPAQSLTHRPHRKRKHHAGHPGSSATQSATPSPSPTRSSPSAVPSVSPRPVSDNGETTAGVVVVLLLIGTATVYLIRRKSRSR